MPGIISPIFFVVQGLYPLSKNLFKAKSFWLPALTPLFSAKEQGRRRVVGECWVAEDRKITGWTGSHPDWNWPNPAKKKKGSQTERRMFKTDLEWEAQLLCLFLGLPKLLGQLVPFSMDQWPLLWSSNNAHLLQTRDKNLWTKVLLQTKGIDYWLKSFLI